MTFTPRTATSIRDDLLSAWSAEYSARGETLLTAAGSSAYLEASMIAVVQSLCDQQARQIARDILPNQASDEAISRFGYVYGIARKTGVKAVMSAQVTGAAPATTYNIPAGTQMSWTDGTLYDVLTTSVTTDGSSHATISVRCTTTGVSGTRAVGNTLTFQSAPSGLNPTASVTAVATYGEAEESFQAWAARIIDRLRDRPASSNRADWRTWVLDYTGTDIVDAYIYPLLKPPSSMPGEGTPDTLGCVTVVAVGPAQGDSTTNTRIVPTDDAATRTPGTLLPYVVAYIEGTRDADGNLTANGTQLRPVTMALGNYTVESINTESIAVVASLTLTSANAFPFTASPALHSSSTTTSIVVTGNYAAGGTEDLSGLSALIYIGHTNYRGGYYRTTLGTGTYNGGTGRTTFPVSTMPHAPGMPSFVYPAPACWDALRSQVFDYFDSLGPSDTTPACRWPTEDAAGRSTLYRSALAGRLTQVDGVLAATITTPGSNTTPATAKTVLVLTTFLVTP